MSRPSISHALRQTVTERAGDRCEYCLVHGDDRPESHQVDHIIALKHGGRTTGDNLALACAVCNNYKGSDVATVDPATEEVIPLFNPRRHRWHDHFRLSGAEIVGVTAIGQATARLLQMNEPERVLFRQVLVQAGLYPPADET